MFFLVVPSHPCAKEHDSLGNTLLEFFRKASSVFIDVNSSETKIIHCATTENCHFVINIEMNPS